MNGFMPAVMASVEMKTSLLCAAGTDIVKDFTLFTIQRGRIDLSEISEMRKDRLNSGTHPEIPQRSESERLSATSREDRWI